MRRLVIAIDFDDVLVDLISVVVEHYNEMYGTTVELKDYYQSNPTPWGVDNIEEASERFHHITKQFHDELVPADTTAKIIKRLSQQHELHIVTGRRTELKRLTEKLIETHFPGCFSSVELTNFFDPALRRTKGEVCMQLQADILIDDHVGHIEDVLSSGLKEVILFGDYPWNQSELPDGVARCLDWAEVEKEVVRIASR